mgnify:CR=1 FL=1
MVRSTSRVGAVVRERLASVGCDQADAWRLYGRDDLTGGSFDKQFGFAPALTEAARAVDGALFVVSIPASEGS